MGEQDAISYTLSKLQEFDKETLIEIILGQAERLKKQRELIDKLSQRIEELEQASRRPAAPFRIAEEKRKKDKKKPGAKQGHQGHFRQLSGPVDERTEVDLPCCPHCSGAIRDKKPVKQHIEELILQPYRVELTTYKGQCARCGKVYSSHPLQTSQAVGSSGCQLGRQATTMALLLNYRYGMSKRKVCSLFSDHFQLPLSIGGLVQLQHRMAGQFAEDYQAMEQALQASAVLYVDETSWYVGRPNYWLWTFTNEQMTYYRVEESRNRSVVEQLLGRQYQGVLVSDCLAVYEQVCERQQKCYAHHLKAISQALEQCPESRYLLQWKQLLKEAMAWKKQQKSKSRQAYREGCARLAIRAGKLLKEQPPDPVEKKIANRLRKQQAHLFTFLLEEQVEPTNNRAERSLRPAVIHRKISCGNKTDKGAASWQVLASIIATASQQNATPFSEKVEAVFNKKLQR